MNTTMVGGDGIIFFIFMGFGCLGLINLFFPRLVWFLKMGWRFRGRTEPSALWIFFSRLWGLIIAAVCFYFAVTLYAPDKMESLTDTFRERIEAFQEPDAGSEY